MFKAEIRYSILLQVYNQNTGEVYLDKEKELYVFHQAGVDELVVIQRQFTVHPVFLFRVSEKRTVVGLTYWNKVYQYGDLLKVECEVDNAESEADINFLAYRLIQRIQLISDEGIDKTIENILVSDSSKGVKRYTSDKFNVQFKIKTPDSETRLYPIIRSTQIILEYYFQVAVIYKSCASLKYHPKIETPILVQGINYSHQVGQAKGWPATKELSEENSKQIV